MMHFPSREKPKNNNTINTLIWKMEQAFHSNMIKMFEPKIHENMMVRRVPLSEGKCVWRLEVSHEHSNLSYGAKNRFLDSRVVKYSSHLLYYSILLSSIFLYLLKYLHTFKLLGVKYTSKKKSDTFIGTL